MLFPWFNMFNQLMNWVRHWKIQVYREWKLMKVAVFGVEFHTSMHGNSNNQWIFNISYCESRTVIITNMPAYSSLISPLKPGGTWIWFEPWTWGMTLPYSMRKFSVWVYLANFPKYLTIFPNFRDSVKPEIYGPRQKNVPIFRDFQ